jgi:hypothetical protein
MARTARHGMDEAETLIAVFDPGLANEPTDAEELSQVSAGTRRRRWLTVASALGVGALLMCGSLTHLIHRPTARLTSKGASAPAAGAFNVAAPSSQAAPSRLRGCPPTASCLLRPTTAADIGVTVQRLFPGGVVVWQAMTVDAHSRMIYRIELDVAAPEGIHVVVLSQRITTTQTGQVPITAWWASTPTGKELQRPHYAAQAVSTVRGRAAITVRVSAHRWLLPSLPLAAAERLGEASVFALD